MEIKASKSDVFDHLYLQFNIQYSSTSQIIMHYKNFKETWNVQTCQQIILILILCIIIGACITIYRSLPYPLFISNMNNFNTNFDLLFYREIANIWTQWRAQSWFFQKDKQLLCKHVVLFFKILKNMRDIEKCNENKIK